MFFRDSIDLPIDSIGKVKLERNYTDSKIYREINYINVTKVRVNDSLYTFYKV